MTKHKVDYDSGDLLKKNIITSHENKKTNKITISIKNTHPNKDKFNPNLYFDKIFIINLKKSKVRWEKIKVNLIQSGVYNFERQEGVYLPRINPFNKLNPLLYQNIEAYGGKYKKDKNYVLNVVGTNMAHFEIVKKAIKRNYQRILVLEDDCFLTKDFSSIFKKEIPYLEKAHWDLIYFGFKKSAPNFIGQRLTNKVIRPVNKIRGAYGYALNKSIFNYLVKNYLYRGTEIDVFFEFDLLKKKRVFAFYPQIIGHRDKLKSTITDKNWVNRN